MGLCGKIKKAAKKVWKKVKAVARTVVKIVTTIVGRVLGIVDLLFGFAAWPPKKLRLHIVILTNSDGNTVINKTDLEKPISFAKKILKDKFNVKLKPFKKEYVEIISEPAPPFALEVHCDSEAFKEEYKGAGEYFADHTAGWYGVPISLKFPITAFIVADVVDKQGCSLGPLTDYLTLDPGGVKSESTLMHEIGHSCGLWHSKTESNIMFKNPSRGEKVKWFQKNLLRSSRHVMYW